MCRSVDEFDRIRSIDTVSDGGSCELMHVGGIVLFQLSCNVLARSGLGGKGITFVDTINE